MYYPLIIAFYYSTKGEYMIYIDDPYQERFEEGEEEHYYNVYNSVDEFLSDIKCVNYVKNKCVLVPNYKPKKRG